MARLDSQSIEFAAQTGKISEGLNPDEAHGHSFFTGGARGLCSAIQMGLVRHAEPEERNLIAMRSVLTGEFRDGVDVFGFAQSIMQNSTDTVLRQKVARFGAEGAKDSRSLADIISTADVNTHFLSDYAIAQSLSGSDNWTFSDLKKRVVTVYVVLPMDYLDLSGYFALIVASALSELLRGKRGVPVLMLMDEFALYPLKAIQTAFGNAAGFGVQLWPVLQDLNQIKDSLHGWETFVSNAGVRMYFGPRDETTSHYLSGQCGQAERRTVSKSISFQDEAEQQAQMKQRGIKREQMNVPNINLSFGSAARPLLLPHETRELEGDEMLLFVENVKGVIRARRRAYWDEPDFRGQYSKNPYFG
jgi:type IV secretion system protein VirD4